MDFNGDWFWHSEIAFTEHQVFSWGTAAVPSWLGLRGQHFHSISQRHRAWEQMAPSRHTGKHCNRPASGARRPFYGWIYNWWRDRGSDRSNRARLVAGPPASHRDGSSPLHWDGLGIKSCKITLSKCFVLCKIPLPTAGKIRRSTQILRSKIQPLQQSWSREFRWERTNLFVKKSKLFPQKRIFFVRFTQ